MAKVRAIMTKHEEKLFQTIKELGVATPDDISERLGISPNCAVVLCQDMVCQDILIKKGYCYEILKMKSTASEDDILKKKRKTIVI